MVQMILMWKTQQSMYYITVIKFSNLWSDDIDCRLFILGLICSHVWFFLDWTSSRDVFFFFVSGVFRSPFFSMYYIEFVYGL